MNWWSSYLRQLRNSRTLFQQFSPFPLHHIFPLTRKIPLAETGCNFSHLKISLKVVFPSSYCITPLLPFRAKPLESTVYVPAISSSSPSIRSKIHANQVFIMTTPSKQLKANNLHYLHIFKCYGQHSVLLLANQQHRTKLITFSKWLSVPFLPFCWFLIILTQSSVPVSIHFLQHIVP